MKKILLLLAICFLTSTGCSNKENRELTDEEVECSCPHATIYLQPFDNFTKQEAEKLIPKLEHEFNYWIYGEWKFKVLEPAPLPKESHVASKNKYEATKILNSLKKLQLDDIVIGLTHKDICHNIHGVQHYGIVGLSYSPGDVCVVSDKRLSKKSLIWKPMMHEFLHAFFRAKHCPNNDPRCFMSDAKGHGSFGIQDRLCDSCKY